MYVQVLNTASGYWVWNSVTPILHAAFFLRPAGLTECWINALKILDIRRKLPVALRNPWIEFPICSGLVSSEILRVDSEILGVDSGIPSLTDFYCQNMINLDTILPYSTKHCRVLELEFQNSIQWQSF